MLIRSQDKEKIINFNNVTEIFRFARQEVVEIRCALTDGECSTIAKYSTKEKVLKVLDAFENFYYDECYLFQMPQEEEV